MTEPTQHLTSFLGDLIRFVEGTGQDSPAMAERRRFAELLRSVNPQLADRADSATPFGLPACRHWAAGLEAEDAPDPVVDLRHALAGLGPWLAWTQNPN